MSIDATMKRGILFVTILLLAAVLSVIYFYFQHSSKSVGMATGGTAAKEESTPSGSASKEGMGRTAAQLPGIKDARLQFEFSGGKELLKVIPTITGGGSGTTTFLYQWTKNGQPAGNEDSITGFKRGDQLSVKITPFDGKTYGEPKTFIAEIRNSPPKVVESREIEIKDNTMTYKVNAYDPDGDTLSYSLIEAPKGMTIDQNGIISWSFGKEDIGTHTVKLKVADGHGGETVWSFSFETGKK